MEKFSLENVTSFVLNKDTLNLDKYICGITEVENSLQYIILSEQSILEAIESENTFVTCYMYLEEVVGYTCITKILDRIDIISIATLKKYSSLKLGTKMLNDIILFAKTNLVNDIILEVRNSNVVAKGLYMKFKFSNIHTRKNYYADNSEDAQIYVLKL